MGSSQLLCLRTFLFKMREMFSAGWWVAGLGCSALLLPSSPVGSFFSGGAVGLCARPQTFLKNSCTRPYLGASGLARLLSGQPGFQMDSVLPACSTTLNKLDKPSLILLRTGLSRVVVERAQAEPFCLLWCRFQRLLSLEASSLEEDLLWSFGEPYFGEQHGRSILEWTLSREEEICLLRTDTSEELRGDQLLLCTPLPRGKSVCRPMLTVWMVCVPTWASPTVWLEALFTFLSSELERMACRTQLVISFMSSLMLPEISRSCSDGGKRGTGGTVLSTVLPSSSSRCCLEKLHSHWL